MKERPKSRAKHALVIILVLVLIVLGAAIATVLVVGASTGRSSFTLGHMLLLTLVIVLLCTSVTLPFFIYAGWRRGRLLDPLFLPRGLLGRRYLLRGRQYHGSIEGREIHSYIHATDRRGYKTWGTDNVKVTRYRGEIIEIFVGAPLKTRMAIVNPEMFGSDSPGKLSRNVELAAAKKVIGKIDAATRGQEVIHGIAALESFRVKGLDPEWGKKLLAFPEVQDAILSLLKNEKALGISSLHVQPAAIYFRTRVALDDLSEELIAIWFKFLLAVATRAESIRSPDNPVEESKWESLNRAKRGVFAKCGCVFAVLLFAILVGLPVLLVWLFRGT